MRVGSGISPPVSSARCHRRTLVICVDRVDSAERPASVERKTAAAVGASLQALRKPAAPTAVPTITAGAARRVPTMGRGPRPTLPALSSPSPITPDPQVSMGWRAARPPTAAGGKALPSPRDGGHRRPDPHRCRGDGRPGCPRGPALHRRSCGPTAPLSSPRRAVLCAQLTRWGCQGADTRHGWGHRASTLARALPALRLTLGRCTSEWQWDPEHSDFRATLPAYLESAALSAMRDATHPRALRNRQDAVQGVESAWSGSRGSATLAAEMIRARIEDDRTSRLRPPLASSRRTVRPMARLTLSTR